MGQSIAGCPFLGGEHMYEIVNCTNDHAGGGIKVEVTWDGEDIGSLAEYELRRYLHGESD